MPNLKRHKQFLKDYSKIKLSDTQFEKLVSYLHYLKDDKALPPEARDHAIKGKWKDFREFHIGGDMLVIYACKDNDIILARIGTHSELF